jgi:hypothetical protein
MERIRGLLVLVACLAGTVPAGARWEADFETGGAFAGYNNVRVPGTDGTDISFTNELQTDPAWFGRGRFGYTFGERHTLMALAAPLRLEATGQVPRAVKFRGVTFAAGIPLTGRYRFDSYRLTYRYNFKPVGRFDFGLGFTAKIRAAAISLEGDGVKTEETNLGFVPIVNFKIDWRAAPAWTALLEGDALAGPQGRAEDVFAGVVYSVSDAAAFKGGYRILEGGADVESVYNFALVNYVAAGCILSF